MLDFGLHIEDYRSNPFEFFKDPSGWLYSDWTEDKLRAYRALDVIPGVSHYMDYLLSIRADREYLDRYGLDYVDIHDPRKLSATGSAQRLNGYVLNWTSKNVDRLYR